MKILGGLKMEEKEVNNSFLANLSDEELVIIFKNEDQGRGSPLWDLCDKYDDEFGGDMLIDEMFIALREEIISRFTNLVLESGK